MTTDTGGNGMDDHPCLRRTTIVRWQDGKSHTRQDYLSIEEPLALEVNGTRVAVLMRLPGAEKELAAGFLISEGIVPRFGDIQILSHCGSLPPRTAASDQLAPRNIVTVTATTVNRPEDIAALLIRSGCGRTDVADIEDQLPVIDSDLQINISVLTDIARQTVALQEVRQLAGGVHLAALFDSAGQLIVAHEDVGRHNAADKVIGHALIRDIPLDDKILYTTGRASYDLVAKAARTSIPVLASKSSPTSLAAELAEATRLTLCGFVRPNRANIYTGEHRILI